jgi:PKD repeat protein
MGRLLHGVMAVLVLVGVGVAFLISGSTARADTIVRGGLNPAGVAVDTAGDVFIADAGDSRVVVDKPNGSGGYTQSVVDNTGLSYPEGVAVDGSGDVFIADTNDNRVLVDKPNGSGGYTQSVVDDSGLSLPDGVAVDASGDVFIADSGHNRVLVDKPNGSGGYTQSVVDSTGLAQLQGVAVDRSGDVFVADAGYERVVVDKPNGSGGYTQSVVDNTGLAYPEGVAVNGAGDVFIADTGNGRVLLDKPNESGGYTQSLVDSTGLSYPAGIAVDASGDVFIADTSHSRVVVDKPNGSGGYTQSVVDDSGLSFPAGVAVDASGDVFIADTGDNRVVVDKPNGSGGYTQSVVDTDLSDPGGVAVNASGDVFIGDTGDNRVVVDKPNGSGGYTQSVVDSTGLNEPFGVAVDRSGDVFIADAYHNRVVVDKPNGSGGYTQSVVDANLSTSYGVAVNASGDVFIADTDNLRVVLDKPNGSGGYTPSVVDAGLDSPAGVAVDGSGDLFIANYDVKGSVVEHAAGAPAAVFSSAQSAGSLSVAFRDASTVAGPATITGWSWNFGDGSPISTEQNPSHTYASPGTFTVSLTVTDSAGQTSTLSQQVVVATPRASLTYPPAGQTNVSTLTPFSWTDIPAGQGYQLWIGTSPGGGSLLKSGLLSATTSTYKVPALPTGETLWARFYTEVAGSWDNWQDVPFTVTGNRVAFTYPIAGQQNINTITPFTWNPATGAQAYQLTIGTKPGVADLVNSGILASNVTTYRVPALPTGTTLYAKIVSKINGSWSDYQAISFTAAPNPVAFTDPTQGQTGVATPTTFTWSTTPAATGYQMWIGTTRGSGSLVKSGWLKPGTSSYPVPALRAGQTLYARIYTGVASGWGNYQDITFTTATTAGASTKSATALAAHQPTPAWMRRLLRLEPNLHRSLRAGPN